MSDRPSRSIERLGKPDWLTIAFVAWSIVAVAIVVRLLTASNIERHSVYPDYIGAARHWLHSVSLYGAERREFRYSPLFAALFTPFTIFPDRIGNIVWRAVNFAAYLTALGGWMRLCLPNPQNRNARGLFLLLCIPLSVGSLNNGQSNPLMAALILAALICVPKERWWLAAIALVFAVHLKLYPIAFGLVVALLWPRKFSGRLFIALLGSIAVCFVLQSPGYVATQFHDWFAFLRTDLRLEQAPHDAYRDLRLLLRLAHLYPGHIAYFVLQLLGGIAVAVVGLGVKRWRVAEANLLVFIYALTTCWILLLGPSTESSTYVLLAPALAGWLINAWSAPHPTMLRLSLVVVCGLLGFAMMANWFPFVSKVHALGLHPLAALIFAGCVVYDLSTYGAKSGATSHMLGSAPL